MTKTVRFRPLCAVLLFILMTAARPVHADLPTPEDVANNDSTALGAPPVVGPDIPISELAHDQHLPAVAYNWRHDEYLVVWHSTYTDHPRDIRAQRVSSSGALLGWSFEVHSDSARDSAQPSVAYDGDNDRYLVTWAYDESGDGSNWDIYARFIPWDGPDAALGTLVVSSWSSSQRVPKVVYNENPNWSEFLVVWVNTPSSIPAYISGRRVLADGSGFPPGAVYTIDSDSTDSYFNPDVAYNLARNEYLVVYSTEAIDIRATRLEANGNILGGGPFNIATWRDMEQRPAVAACRTADQYFVVWQSLKDSTHFDIYGRFVTGEGVTADVLHIRSTSGDEVLPDIACIPSAHHYLVAWGQQYDSGDFGVWGRLLHTDKTQDAAFGIVGAHGDRYTPAVAAGSPSYLVAWEHERYGTTYTDIHGRLVWPAVIYLPLMLRNHMP